MKFVLGLVYLVSILVATSPQQFHQQRSGQQLWWSQYLQPQTTEASGHYSDTLDGINTPYFRYSNPIHNIRPTVIYPENEEESYRHQEVLDRKQYHSDQNALIDDQLKRQYLFLIEQLMSGRRQSGDGGDSKIRSGGLIIPVMAAGHHSARPTTTIPSQMAMTRIKNYGPVRIIV